MATTYLFITNPKEYDAEGVKGGGYTWSCPKDSREGELALVYLTGGPGIKYEWRIASDATPDKKWKYLCKVKLARTFKNPIGIGELCSEFSPEEWKPPHLQFRRFTHLILPDDIATRIRMLRKSPKEIRLARAKRGKKPFGRHGAGFGIPVTNVAVERAAVKLVTTTYRKHGWSVDSVERDKKYGFDLRCRKGKSVQEVEVKGIAGQGEAFFITANEVNQGESNPRWMICVVSDALSKDAHISTYSGKEFLGRFALNPIQFAARIQR